LTTLRVAYGSAVLGGVQVFTKSLDLVVALIVARLLTPADFGLVAIGVSVLAITKACTDLPLIDALVQKEKVDRADFDTVFTLSALRGLIIFAILASLAVPLAAAFNDDRLVPMIALLSAAPIATGFASPKIVGFVRDVNFAPTALIEIAGKLTAFALAITLAWTTRSYWALVASLVSAPIITMAASYLIAPYRPRFSFERVQSLVSFAGWMSLSRALNALNMQADRFFIGGMLGKSILGQYSVGSDLASTATYSFAAPIMQTFFSGFSRIKDQRERLVAAYIRGQSVLVALVLPLGFGAAVIAHPLINLILGPQWGGAAFTISWLAPVIALQMTAVAAHSVALALGKPNLIFRRDLLALGVRLPATLVAAYFYGLHGAVIARALTGIIMIYINLHLIQRLIGATVWQQLANCTRSIASVVAMVVAVAVTSHFLELSDLTRFEQGVAIGVLAAAGALAYAISHVALWLLGGKPGGPETFAIEVLKLIVSRVFRGPSKTNVGH
jgi:lipopolysaccharide exporter